MARLVIAGGRKLNGTLEVEGAKNAVLPMMAASLLAAGETRLDNVPDVQDVRVMAELIRSTGAKLETEGSTLHIDATNVDEGSLPNKLAGKIRYSLHMVGGLLPRLGGVETALPGGDNIGTRRVDLHVAGLSALGATIDVKSESISIRADVLRGTDITLRYASVGATENIMIAACLARGTTTIRNAAKEPEVVDLADFLGSMGARIAGAGSDIVEIAGVDRLRGTKYTAIPDRQNVGTYVVAAAITHGNILITNANLAHLGSVVTKLQQAGVEVTDTTEGIEVSAPGRFRPLDIVTDVYPGFPTDMNPIVAPLLALADGQSTIRETVFDGRFTYVTELKRMGSRMDVEGDTVLIRGVRKLKGARVKAKDIRGGAAMVVAGLAAEGETVVENVYEIDRGYHDTEGKLRAVGADIVRVG
jgi:UDP-N-acetylglucosamine 1-carboxyvinyltransferase